MKRLVYFLLAFSVGVGLLPATPALADVTTLNYDVMATAIDEGPQDGVFDTFMPLNLGSVDNNGYGNIRTAFEFDLSGIPSGATITSARLDMDLSNWEAMRTIEVHGYAGSGSVQLADFASNNLLGTEVVEFGPSQHFTVDVSSFVANLFANGETAAGFNVREEPANEFGYTIMSLEGVSNGSLPNLTIEYSTEQIVDIDIRPGSDTNNINLCSQGVLPVAILSSPDFDATNVDPVTVRLADATVKVVGKAGKLLCHTEDVNSDGLTDLICQVAVSEMAVALGTTDTQATLRAHTADGTAIVGSDSINIVKDCSH